MLNNVTEMKNSMKMCQQKKPKEHKFSYPYAMVYYYSLNLKHKSNL